MNNSYEFYGNPQRGGAPSGMSDGGGGVGSDWRRGTPISAVKPPPAVNVVTPTYVNRVDNDAPHFQHQSQHYPFLQQQQQQLAEHIDPARMNPQITYNNNNYLPDEVGSKRPPSTAAPFSTFAPRPWSLEASKPPQSTPTSMPTSTPTNLAAGNRIMSSADIMKNVAVNYAQVVPLRERLQQEALNHQQQTQPQHRSPQQATPRSPPQQRPHFPDLSGSAPNQWHGYAPSSSAGTPRSPASNAETGRHSHFNNGFQDNARDPSLQNRPFNNNGSVGSTNIDPNQSIHPLSNKPPSNHPINHTHNHPNDRSNTNSPAQDAVVIGRLQPAPVKEAPIVRVTDYDREKMMLDEQMRRLMLLQDRVNEVESRTNGEPRSETSMVGQTRQNSVESNRPQNQQQSQNPQQWQNQQQRPNPPMHKEFSPRRQSATDDGDSGIGEAAFRAPAPPLTHASLVGTVPVDGFGNRIAPSHGFDRRGSREPPPEVARRNAVNLARTETSRNPAESFVIDSTGPEPMMRRTMNQSDYVSGSGYGPNSGGGVGGGGLLDFRHQIPKSTPHFEHNNSKDTTPITLQQLRRRPSQPKPAQSKAKQPAVPTKIPSANLLQPPPDPKRPPGRKSVKFISKDGQIRSSSRSCKSVDLRPSGDTSGPSGRGLTASEALGVTPSLGPWIHRLRKSPSAGSFASQESSEAGGRWSSEPPTSARVPPARLHNPRPASDSFAGRPAAPTMRPTPKTISATRSSHPNESTFESEIATLEAAIGLERPTHRPIVDDDAASEPESEYLTPVEAHRRRVKAKEIHKMLSKNAGGWTREALKEEEEETPEVGRGRRQALGLAQAIAREASKKRKEQRRERAKSWAQPEPQPDSPEQDLRNSGLRSQSRDELDSAPWESQRPLSGVRGTTPERLPQRQPRYESAPPDQRLRGMAPNGIDYSAAPPPRNLAPGFQTPRPSSYGTGMASVPSTRRDATPRDPRIAPVGAPALEPPTDPARRERFYADVGNLQRWMAQDDARLVSDVL